MVLRGISLEINLRARILIALPLKSSPNKSWNHCFVIFWEALQFEVVVP